jgi:hypothetical protein
VNEKEIHGIRPAPPWPLTRRLAALRRVINHSHPRLSARRGAPLKCLRTLSPVFLSSAPGYGRQLLSAGQLAVQA